MFLLKCVNNSDFEKWLVKGQLYLSDGIYKGKDGGTYYNIFLDPGQNETQGYLPFRFQVVSKIKFNPQSRLARLIK